MTKLRKLLKVIYYINNFAGVDTKFLQEKLNVSRRTIFRYLDDIRSIPDIKLEYVSRHKGYEIRFTDEADKIYNNKNMYIWTTKDMKILEALTKADVADIKIANLLGRSVNAIRQQRQKMNIKKR